MTDFLYSDPEVKIVHLTNHCLEEIHTKKFWIPQNTLEKLTCLSNKNWNNSTFFWVIFVFLEINFFCLCLKMCSIPQSCLLTSHFCKKWYSLGMKKYPLCPIFDLVGTVWSVIHKERRRLKADDPVCHSQLWLKSNWC